MPILHILCFVSTVYAPRCHWWPIPSPNWGKSSWQILRDNSKIIRTIDVVTDESGAASVDIRQLTDNDALADLFLEGELMPRTNPDSGEWMMWGDFDDILTDMDDDTYTFVVSERRGKGSVKGRLVGFAVLSSRNGGKGFDLDYLEIDKLYRKKGLSKRLAIEAFSIAKGRGGNLNLVNCASCKRRSAWLYLLSAHEAGYKFAHVNSETIVFPLGNLRDTYRMHRATNWNSGKLTDSDAFTFTMGQHPAYKQSSAKTINRMHIVELEQRHINRMREAGTWESSFPPDWKDAGLSQDEFVSFFAFGPDTTNVLQGALLLKKRLEFTVEWLYMFKHATYDQTLRTLLLSMFSYAKQNGKSSIAMKAIMFSGWRLVDRKAQTYEYVYDEAHSSNEWRIYRFGRNR